MSKNKVVNSVFNEENDSVSLLTDYYQISMAYGYFLEGMHEKEATFDYFFRELPFKGGLAVTCGLRHLFELLDNFRFTDQDIEFLKNNGPSGSILSNEFLDYLKNLKFTLTIKAIPEGSLVFQDVPILEVTGPIIQCQLIETLVLYCMNFPTLIASKAVRIAEVCKKNGSSFIEFGLRRAQNPLIGSMAAFVGGAYATSNVKAAQIYGIPYGGTHAHSWVQAFPDELSSFRSYAKHFSDTTILLIDTYDTLKGGLPSAIRVAKELEKRGKKLLGVRIDSGDLAYISRQCRKAFDENDLSYVKIIASGDLDEYIINSLVEQKAPIDIWGVGTRLITSYDQPAIGGVYKLVDYEAKPVIKISNIVKMTNPGRKNLFRLTKNGFYEGDIIASEDEKMEQLFGGEVIDPRNPSRRYILPQKSDKISLKQILIPYYIKGQESKERKALALTNKEHVYAIQERASQEMKKIDPSYKRLYNPHEYKVSMSSKLWKIKESMIDYFRKRNGDEKEKR